MNLRELSFVAKAVQVVGANAVVIVIHNRLHLRVAVETWTPIHRVAVANTFVSVSVITTHGLVSEVMDTVVTKVVLQWGRVMEHRSTETVGVVK